MSTWPIVYFCGGPLHGQITLHGHVADCLPGSCVHFPVMRQHIKPNEPPRLGPDVEELPPPGEIYYVRYAPRPCHLEDGEPLALCLVYVPEPPREAP